MSFLAFFVSFLSSFTLSFDYYIYLFVINIPFYLILLFIALKLSTYLAINNIPFSPCCLLFNNSQPILVANIPFSLLTFSIYISTFNKIFNHCQVGVC